MILIIPAVPDSLNKLLRKHWAVRRKYNQMWNVYIRCTIPFAPDRNRRKRKVHIHQTRVRLLDADNLVGSCKPVIDALRKWNILYDDKPQYMDLKVTQSVGHPVCTTIEVK